MPYDYLDGSVLIRNIPDNVHIGTKQFQSAINTIKKKNNIPVGNVSVGFGNDENEEQKKELEKKNDASYLDAFAPAIRGAAPAIAGAVGGGLLGAATGGIPGALIGASRGVAGTELANIVGGPIVSGINAAFGTNFNTPSDAFENLLNSIGVPESKTITAKLLEALASAASGTMGVNKFGKELSQLGSTTGNNVAKEVGQELARNPAQDFATAAGGSLATEIARENNADSGEQLLAAIAGGLAGGKSVGSAKELLDSSLSAKTKLPLSKEEIITKLGKEHNIPIMTSDVIEPNTFAKKSIQQLGERTLGGTGKKRLEQQEARKDAVYDVAKKQNITPKTKESSDDFSLLASEDLLKNRKKIIDQKSNQKNNIIATLSKDSDSFEPKGIESVINKSINEFKSSNRSEMKSYAKKLKENYYDFLQDPTLKSLNDFRARLGVAFKDAEYDPIRKEITKNQKDLYNAIKNDIYSAAKKYDQKNNTQLLSSLSEVDKDITSFNVDLKKSRLRNAIMSGESTPENLGKLIFSSNASDMASFKKNLTPSGVKNAKSAIMQRIVEKSNGYEDLSVEKFSSNLKKYGPQIATFFDKEERQYIDGLNTVLKATRRASDAAVSTQSGQQAYNLLLYGGLPAFLGPKGLLLAGGAGLAAKGYESKHMRDLLIKIAKSKKNQKAQEVYVNKFIDMSKKMLLSTRGISSKNGEKQNDSDN